MKPSHTVTNFCKNIKGLRERCGLSVEDMAKLCNVSVSTLHKAESGELSPRSALVIVAGLHDALGVSPSQLISEDCLED
ncbi:MAG: helix-turn-helix domain-containing protein [Clostridia bacterium]|nr:helix-turn-helix domain-containing protein [Clostridia bacterium]